VNVVFQFTDESKKYGFSYDGSGVHSSRTIMAKELAILINSVPQAENIFDYQHAIIEDNVLLKKTFATRKESFTRLRTIYSLDPKVLVFRALKDLWETSSGSQSLLSLLCAICRDKFLRASTSIIINTPIGQSLNSEEFEKHIQVELPDFAKKTVETMSRNISSSWTQSGHLAGRNEKIRSKVIPTAPVVAYALLMGYLCGARGDNLFETPWIKVLDSTVYSLHNLAKNAALSGWLDYKKSGEVTEITFKYLMRNL
jgi:hypothetical protein